MNFLAQLWRRILHYLWRGRFDRELEEEMRFHLEMRTEENLSTGMSSEEALYAAKRQFGNQTRLREVSHEMWGFNSLETLIRDLRVGLRMLLKHPGFTMTTILTLALGIGANTAIFSMVNSVLLRPLPFKNPSQLVLVWGTAPQVARSGLSAPNFLDYKEQNRVFEYMATFNSGSFTFTGAESPERVRGGRVTSDFFKVLEVEPIMGRTFLQEEGQAGQNNVVVLSYGLWQRRFGSDPRIVGQTLQLDTKPYTVIGVMPADFEFSVPNRFRPVELWVSERLPRDNAQRTNNYLNVIARLKSGVTLQQAQENMEAITARLAQEYSQSMAGSGVRLVSLHDQIVGDIRPVLLILFGVVGFVLLIACANVANLQLARVSERQKEIAIRTALGASRGRVMRQLLTESVLLSLVGGALGVLMASWGVKLLLELAPTAILPRGGVSGIDSAVLFYSLGISVLTGILFGLAPALQSPSTGLSETLKEGGRSSTASGGRLRSALIVAEVALSLVLLVGAGLLIRSFVQLLGVPPGFDAQNVLTLSLNLPKYSYPDAPKRAAFYRQALEGIRSLPGVEAAGAIDDLPLTTDRDASSFIIEGRPQLAPNRTPVAQMRSVTPDYFRAMGIPLLVGRSFTEADTNAAPAVLMINQSLARRLFPNENPLGQRLTFNASGGDWMTVVGIVGDVRDLGLDTPADIEVYQPYQQSTLPYMNLVVRAASDASNLAGSVRDEIHRLDKDLPIPTARPMKSVMEASISERRFHMIILGLFAGLALGLAAMGIYGVISYTVARRTREIGIRLALGAQPRDVLNMVIKQGMMLVLIGVVAGIIAAFALTRVLAGLLFGVGATDPLTFVSIAILLAAVALIACYIPARQAMKVDPMIALRNE